jgi:hypothetical protein
VVIGEYSGRCVSAFAKVAEQTLGYSNVSINEKYTLRKKE